MIAREKEILKFLFTGRKAPALRQEEALEHFLGGDRRRLGLLLEHDFGFTPRVTLREGLRKFAEWYKEYYG